jgi:hypothetical protein
MIDNEPVIIPPFVPPEFTLINEPLPIVEPIPVIPVETPPQ